MVACVTKLDKKCISMRVPSLRWTLWSFAFENTLIIQISEIQVPVLIIVPLHQWNAEPYFNLAETFSECNKLSEMKNELTDRHAFSYRRFRSCGNSSEMWCSTWRLNRNCPRRLKSHRPSSSRVMSLWGVGPRGQAPPPAQRRAAKRTAERGRVSFTEITICLWMTYTTHYMLYVNLFYVCT